EYVEAMWKMLNSDGPRDLVVATGETHSVREFAELAFKRADYEIEWEGKGVNEKGVDASTGDVLVEVDEKYFRPAEVDILKGDPSRAKKEIGWESKTNFKELVSIMVDADIKTLEEKGELGLDYLQ
ncbi:GDP-mannose 4,6-dehydratase, partial [Patescibacteria group bacterium]|nr:GDP-mannose 4,6-dehydratase [Patescibacteria group bacterium]